MTDVGITVDGIGIRNDAVSSGESRDSHHTTAADKVSEGAIRHALQAPFSFIAERWKAADPNSPANKAAEQDAYARERMAALRERLQSHPDIKK